MAIWVFKNGVREGPYEDRDIRELIYEGTYSDADTAVRDGDPAQRTVGELLGHSPATAPAPERLTKPAVADAAPPPIQLPSSVLAKPDASLAAPPPLPPAPAVASPPVPAQPTPPAEVAVVDFSMPFASMVVFMVKWALAAIPAFLILGVVIAVFWTALFTFVAGIFASLMHH